MNVLAVFAHPDDETMLCGGTLAILARRGVKVHYLCATRGEGGELGEPPVCTREELGAVREQELVCAVQALGGSSLTFLGYIDPLVGPEDTLYPFTDDMTVLAGQVALSIQQHRPAAVITHGAHGEYGHPAHVTIHQAVEIAVRAAAREAAGESADGAPALYTVQADFAEHPRPRLANPGEDAHLVLDVSPVMEQKIQAAMCQRSQHALFVRRASEEAGRALDVPEVIVPLESLRRVLPLVDGELNDPLARALAEAGVLIEFVPSKPQRREEGLNHEDTTIH